MKKTVKDITSLFGAIALSAMPVLFEGCRNKENVASTETVKQAETAPYTIPPTQGIRQMQDKLPLDIYIVTESNGSSDQLPVPRYVADGIIHALRQLDSQAENVGVDLIRDIRTGGGISFTPVRTYIVRGDSDQRFLSSAIRNDIDNRGEIILGKYAGSSPLASAYDVSSLLMQRLLGKSPRSDDLTSSMFHSQSMGIKLSERDLYELARVYGSVKVPKK